MRFKYFFHIDEAGWYVLVRDGQEWHRVCKGGSFVSSTAQDGRFYCGGCQRSFSRSQDKPDTVVTVFGHVVRQAL